MKDPRGSAPESGDRGARPPDLYSDERRNRVALLNKDKSLPDSVNRGRAKPAPDSRGGRLRRPPSESLNERKGIK
jgi:hypothetical protein